ncbi:S8 family peptidase [Xylaria bambusicola]|uniref:S8 family peptidase n=1 Tax=Xylaria bambusicola TaxID=326684 RepID=UPI002008BA69|nr:S8 family peptidase [Xylaria bambusicola]KAI0515128.1 S8 family peptidase [Xylaria bambusicola]
MAHTQDNLIALQLVASIALESSKILFPLAIANQSGPAANVAIQLKFIAENISEQELSKIPPEAQTVSTKALHDLLQIAEWPPSKTSRDQPHIEKGPQELRRTLIRLFQNEESKRRVRQSVTKFCKERPNVIQPFASRFTYLSDLLSKNSVESQWNLTGTATHSSPPPRDVYPDQVNKLLIDGVQSHATCMREGHVGSGLQATASPNWHTTKLCLESGFCTEDKRVLFKVVTATSRMTHWQEFAFRVPMQQCKEKFDPSMFTLIANGDACKYLDNPTYARLSIVEQKIKLSYTVARAFWQFYNSELMNVRWTSEDILLFRLDQDISPPGDVLLRVFVSFPFGDEGKKSPAESYDEGYYTHRYPRILCLGIILLEIGLGQAIEMGSSSESFSVEHINRVHIKAELKLRELKKTKWDGFRSKACFDEAVENCLESVNFRETTNRQRTQHQSHSVKKPHLSERRDALYRKVVAPLFRLAMVGYQDSDEPRLIRIPNEVRSKSISANDEMLQRSWDEIHHTHSSFLSGHSGNREGFLHHLQVIAGHITRCRRVAKTIKPIRVAILDTGCYKELEFFKDDRRSTRIRGWKDLTTAGSHSATDTFGHGTFMARLLMHVAPIADIYIIRVAENTEDLESHEQDIVKAIIHAGLGPEWKADIISMSFGMSNERKQKCRNISDAIDKVTKERDGSVLFFAAAGNQGIRKENFPASHGDVISIYATNSEGAFLDSNPSQSDDGPKLLGTYGAEIPPSITDEIRTHFPDADLSAGSSIATAIAAGIAAMMLSYVAALPSLLNYTPFETVCAKLHTRSGMQQMLYSMSVLKGYKHYFINPIGFWGERKKDLELLTTVCAAVDKIND